MQAVEIIKAFEKGQTDKETRSIAIALYISLVTFTIQEFKDFHRSIAFQIFEVPEQMKNAVAIYPSEINNLHKLNEKTVLTVEFHIASASQILHEALLENLRICEIILAIMERFAKKYSLNYNTDLETESFHNLKLVFQFERLLAYE